LCDKVKPITSDGLNLPTSSFTARVIATNEKKTYFRFVSVWFWCSKCFIIPYIFNKHKTWSPFILPCCELIWGLEGAELLWSAPGDT